MGVGNTANASSQSDNEDLHSIRALLEKEEGSPASNQPLEQLVDAPASKFVKDLEEIEALRAAIDGYGKPWSEVETPQESDEPLPEDLNDESMISVDLSAEAFRGQDDEVAFEKTDRLPDEEECVAESSEARTRRLAREFEELESLRLAVETADFARMRAVLEDAEITDTKDENDFTDQFELTRAAKLARDLEELEALRAAVDSAYRLAGLRKKSSGEGDFANFRALLEEEEGYEEPISYSTGVFGGTTGKSRRLASDLEEIEALRAAVEGFDSRTLRRTESRIAPPSGTVASGSLVVKTAIVDDSEFVANIAQDDAPDGSGIADSALPLTDASEALMSAHEEQHNTVDNSSQFLANIAQDDAPGGSGIADSASPPTDASGALAHEEQHDTVDDSREFPGNIARADAARDGVADSPVAAASETFTPAHEEQSNTEVAEECSVHKTAREGAANATIVCDGGLATQPSSDKQEFGSQDRGDSPQMSEDFSAEDEGWQSHATNQGFRGDADWRRTRRQRQKNTGLEKNADSDRNFESTVPKQDSPDYKTNDHGLQDFSVEPSAIVVESGSGAPSFDSDSDLHGAGGTEPELSSELSHSSQRNGGSLVPRHTGELSLPGMSNASWEPVTRVTGETTRIAKPAQMSAQTSGATSGAVMQPVTDIPAPGRSRAKVILSWRRLALIALLIGIIVVFCLLSNSSRSFSQAGLLSYKAGQYSQAISLLDRALVIDPELIEARKYKARSYQALGNVDESLKQYDMVLVRSPDDTDSLKARAKIHLEKGDWELAIKDLERLSVLEKTPDGSYWRAYALALDNLGNLPQATDAYEKAIQLAKSDDPPVRDMRMARARCLRKSSLWLEAAEECSQILARSPRDRDALVERAHDCVAAHEFTQAHADLQNLTALFPKDPEVHFVLAQYYAGQNDKKNAVLEFDIVLKMKPDWAVSIARETDKMNSP